MEITIKAGIIILLSIISGYLYRAGGIGKPFKSWMRDWIIPPVTLIALWLLVGFKSSYWWIYLIIWGLMGGALSTYFDELFGYDNYWFAGFICGLAAFPLFLAGIHWHLILVRAIVLAVLWGGWCKIFSKDWVEEFFRGFSIIATLPILFI